MAKKQLDKLLQSQGFGSRKECQRLIQAGRVTIHGQVVDNYKQLIEVAQLRFSIDGEPFDYREFVYIALYKPKGFECSHQPQRHPSVFSLLPSYLRQRNIQTVGRLDQDTTGLLLLSDDGQFVHQQTHPKKQIFKRYRVTTAEPITDAQMAQLGLGVVLHHEQEVFMAQHIQRISDDEICFEISQGIYHQVKRMLAAVGHRVVALHRERVGQYGLDQLALAEGEWCYISVDNQL